MYRDIQSKPTLPWMWLSINIRPVCLAFFFRFSLSWRFYSSAAHLLPFWVRPFRVETVSWWTKELQIQPNYMQLNENGWKKNNYINENKKRKKMLHISLRWLGHHSRSSTIFYIYFFLSFLRFCIPLSLSSPVLFSCISFPFRLFYNIHFFALAAYTYSRLDASIRKERMQSIRTESKTDEGDDEKKRRKIEEEESRRWERIKNNIKWKKIYLLLSYVRSALADTAIGK